MTLPNSEVVNSIVGRVFRIEDVTLGDPKSDFIMRYRGHLVMEDSAAAYDQLYEALKPMNITPLFREEKEQQLVYLIPGPTVKTKQSRVSVNIGLFLITLLSVMFAGTMYSYQGPALPTEPNAQIWAILLNIWQGWPFAVSLLSILLAHEFGHYFAGRIHKTDVSLPYFIPFPLSFMGTMGAFINMRERPRNKRILLDIAIAGPLAGLVVAIPVLIFGLLNSRPDTLLNTRYTHIAGQADLCPNSTVAGDSYTCPDDNMLEGNSVLYLGLKYITRGELLPAPVSYNGSALVYWLRFFFTGSPLPIGGRDIMLNPVAMAGWAGILVTFLNLIPAGQLDGGHVLYALFGKNSRKLLWFVMIPMIGLGFIWNGWWLWAALIYFIGRANADPNDQITKLNPCRKVLAGLVLVIFLLVFTPVPFIVF
jgi:membrane-associated protease RseP (regulator of RpoE activity)